MRYVTTSGWLLALALATASPVAAQPARTPAAPQATDPWRVVVPVADTSAANRSKAFATGLAQVLRRVSTHAPSNEVLASASTFVQQYQYERAPAGAAEPFQLVVRFAPAAIEHLERSLAAPVVQVAAPATATGTIATPVVSGNDSLVWVSGIRSAVDFADAVAAIDRAPGVDNVGVRVANGDGMLLDVRTSMPLAQVLAGLAQGGHLTAAGAAHAGAAANLRWTR